MWRVTTGEEMRAWRLGAGLSQAEAARRVGVCQVTWSSWERGRIAPRIAHAVAIEAMTAGAVPVRAWLDDHAAERTPAA